MREPRRLQTLAHSKEAFWKSKIRSIDYRSLNKGYCSRSRSLTSVEEPSKKEAVGAEIIPSSDQ